ncbi:MAG: YlxR family protein [Clostridia bacterium]|nr:YlxR family protein [Clostridia bacterium]MBQ8914807.1 YlxR family protein [Clostridia bacterium]
MEQKVRKIPMRQCLGCNEHKPKREMLRVLRTPEGEILLDLTGKKSGRGAYICPKASCLKKARKTKRIDRELGVTIDEAVYDEMERVLAEEFGD